MPLVNVTVPTLLPSTRNWTEPVGVPEPGATGLTVAVNVIESLAHTGLAEEVTAVVESALFTVCVRLPEVSVLKLPSPL